MALIGIVWLNNEAAGKASDQSETSITKKHNKKPWTISSSFDTGSSKTRRTTKRPKRKGLSLVTSGATTNLTKHLYDISLSTTRSLPLPTFYLCLPWNEIIPFTWLRTTIRPIETISNFFHSLQESHTLNNHLYTMTPQTISLWIDWGRDKAKQRQALFSFTGSDIRQGWRQGAKRSINNTRLGKTRKQYMNQSSIHNRSIENTRVTIYSKYNNTVHSNIIKTRNSWIQGVKKKRKKTASY